LKRPSKGEKGNAKIFGLVFLALFVVLAAGLAWWLSGKKSKPVGPSPTASPSASLGDPAEATDRLLKALNQRLETLDLLKLLTEDVQTQSVTAHGKTFAVYSEKFRLPMRFTPGELASQLEDAARLVGARLLSPPVPSSDKTGQTLYEFKFAYDSQWIPVQIAFIQTTQPRICIIIDDGGYQKGNTLEHLYGFKVPVTLAIIPGAEFSAKLAEEVPSHGIEVMCHMPMEGHEKGRVGEGYQHLLKVGMKARDVENQLVSVLDSLPHCRGLNNHMGSLATADPELMWEVCQVLKSRNLFIIDSRTTAQSAVEKMAQKALLPVTHRDVFLDNVEEPEAILKQLDQLVGKAKKRGWAVGIGHFKLITLKTLEEAIPGLKEQGFQFVFASEIVK
jgi:uncharacterized protein